MNFGWSRYLRLAKLSHLHREAQEFLKLAIPLIGAQLAQSAIGLVDTLMMGRLGQETLAAGGLAAMTFMAFLYTAIGIVMGVSPIVAATYGSGQKSKIEQVLGQGWWLVIGLTLPNMWCLANLDVLMRQLGQAETTIILGNTYLDIMVWGFLPALGFALLRSVISAMSHARPIMAIMIGGTILNILGNYSLGFGKFGLPRLEIAGMAISSVFALWMMFLALVIYTLVNKNLQPYRFLRQFPHFNPPVFKELLWLGLPIGIAITLESGLFTIVTYLMGILGTAVLAAHQIVFQTIIITFMVPLGMSYAATIRVGHWFGQQNRLGTVRAGYVSFSCGVGFMSIMAILLLTFPQHIIGLYIDLQDPHNTAVIALAKPMLRVAAVAQIIDGLQKIAMGALYGLQDTQRPMLLSFAAFWGVGLTSGYLLGFHTNLGGVGLWIGQTMGVAIASLMFVWRFHRLTARQQS
jgi:multidrug resistance protein, MATE family